MFRRLMICLWLSLFVLGVGVVYANPVIDIAPNDVNTGLPFTGMAGDRGPNALSIPVSITNDISVGKVAALGFVVKYDPARIEFSAAQSLDPNKQASSNFSDPNRTPGELKILFVGINNAVILNGVDGPILNLRFNILPSATLGDASVQLTVDPEAATPDALPIPLDNGNQLAAVTINAANPAGSLSLVANPVNGGTVSADPMYDSNIPYNIGNLVNLAATPAAGYTFVNWTCTGIQTDLPAPRAINSITLVDTANLTCTANFALITYNLTLNTNPANRGTFASNPLPASPPSGAIYGINKFVPNTSVQVTFTPSSGYTFTGWTGSGCVTAPSVSTDNPLTVVMAGSKTCTANVILTPIDGVCGPSNGGNFPTPPTTGLCTDTSTPTVTTANDKYSWICAGTNGGTSANCSANVQKVGACGTSNGGSFVTAPTAGFCVDNSTPTVTTANDKYSWTCAGTNGGASASCSANVQTNGVCGISNGGSFATAPASSLCGDGSLPQVSTVNGKWSWSCSGTNGGSTATCTANIQASVACGTSANGNFASAPTQNLCADGSLPQVGIVNGQWNWICVGTNGGLNTTCTANIQTAGACGTSANGSFPAAPTQNLCGDGSTPTVSTVNGQWSWSCAGTNGGASVTCTANIPNNVPVAKNQNVTTQLNTAQSITLEASDLDNDPMNYSIVAPPVHGALTGSGSTLIYTPNTNFSGNDSFSFKANDGKNDSNVATVSITVTAINDKPTLVVSAISDGASTNVQTFNLSGTFSDQDGVAAFSMNGVQAVPVPPGVFSYAYGLSVGDNTFTTSVVDVLGNVTTDTRTITYDPNGPQMTISAPADNSKTKEVMVVIEGAVLDENASVYVSVNGSASTFVYQGKGNFSTSVALIPDTLNTIEVIAIDQLGNTTSVKRSVTNDSKGPDLAIIDPAADTETTNSSYILKGTVSADAVSVTVVFDGKTYNPPIINGTYEQVLPLTAAKTYQASVSTTDSLGNITSVVSRNIIKKSTWNDVSAKVAVTKSYPVYDRINNVYYVLVKVTNPAGNAPMSGALRMVVSNPSPSLKTALAGLKPNGTTPAGEPYFDILPEGSALATSASISNLRLNFEVKLPVTFGVRIEQLN